MMNNIKTVFFGTSDFAVPIIESLMKNTDLLAVVSMPDRPAGRSQEVTSTPVSVFARNNDLDLFQFESLKSEEVAEALKGLEADLFIVAAYGKIIPQAILDIPTKGAINVHGSILPKYRGASPIHAAILNGDTFTGNTIMIMDAAMDHGPVLISSKVNIDPNDDFKSLEQRMSQDGAELLIKAISGYLDGSIKPIEQDHSLATVTKLISKADGLINWTDSPERIFNQWRAYKIWPGAYSYITDSNGHKIRLTFNNIKKSAGVGAREPGTIIFDQWQMFVSVGEAVIEVIELTLEGKKMMAAKDFINGFQRFNGQVLSSDISK